MIAFVQIPVIGAAVAVVVGWVSRYVIFQLATLAFKYNTRIIVFFAFIGFFVAFYNAIDSTLSSLSSAIPPPPEGLIIVSSWFLPSTSGQIFTAFISISFFKLVFHFKDKLLTIFNP